MKLSREDVLHIAELAKLELSEQEIEAYSTQISDILDYFDVLNRLDTSGIPPTASVLDLHSIMRADEAAASLKPSAVLANAPDAEDDQFKVNAVLD